MKNYFFHRLNGFFLALWLVLGTHAAGLGGSVASAATPADSGLADFVHDTCVFDSCCSTFLLVGRLVLNDPLSPTFQESNVDGTPVSTAPDVVVVTDRSLNVNQLEANELLRRLRRVQRDL